MMQRSVAYLTSSSNCSNDNINVYLAGKGVYAVSVVDKFCIIFTLIILSLGLDLKYHGGLSIIFVSK